MGIQANSGSIKPQNEESAVLILLALSDTDKRAGTIWRRASGSRRCSHQRPALLCVMDRVGDGDCLPVYRFTEVGSGNQTMRVFFPVALENKERHAFMEQMKRLAASIEWADGQLCALSLPTLVVFETVFEALVKLEVSGVLAFETTEWVDHETW